MSVDSPIISFSNPPVVEVTCSIVFEEIDLEIPHVGLIWASWHDDLPHFQALPPVQFVIEGGEDDDDSIDSFEEIDVPPLPRLSFSNKDNSNTLEIQKHSLLFRWRKKEGQADYPRFGTVYKQFTEYLDTVATFSDWHDLGKIQPVQYYLRYINLIPKGVGWDKSSDLSGVLPQFAAHMAKRDFLPAPGGLYLQWFYDMPDGLGRLYVRVVTPSNSDSVEFTLSCRGIGQNKNIDKMNDWFENARAWIVRGFADLTTKDVQYSIWGREDHE